MRQCSGGSGCDERRGGVRHRAGSDWCVSVPLLSISLLSPLFLSSLLSLVSLLSFPLSLSYSPPCALSFSPCLLRAPMRTLTPPRLYAPPLSLPHTHTHTLLYTTLPQDVRLVPPRSASTIPPWGSSWSATGSSRVAFFRPATRSKQTYPTSTVSVFQQHVT